MATEATDLRYGTLALAASRAGVSLTDVAFSLGVQLHTLYTWGQRGIPGYRQQDVAELVDELRSSPIQDLDFTALCTRYGLTQLSVARSLGIMDRSYERWGVIGVPAHLRERCRHIIPILAELRSCRQEMNQQGYVPIGQGIKF